VAHARPHVRALDDLPGLARTAIEQIALFRRFDAGTTVVAEGDPADSLFVITAGRVAVRVGTADGDELTLTILGPGDMVGEIALVGATGLRTASIVAVEPVETMIIRRTDFDELRARVPSVEGFLVAVLADRVVRLTGQLRAALYLSLDDRVARVLDELVDTYREASDAPGGPVTIRLTQDDVAGIVGASRQQCNRALRRLAASGVIRPARGRIVVVDPVALRSMVTAT